MIGMVPTKMFFDRKPVMRAAGRATRRVLSRFGAFVRTTARSSIRRRKRVSDPGQPPSSHSGHLKRGILFGYDARRDSVVIGPMPFNAKNSQDALEMLEHGGTTWRRLGTRRNRRRVRATYKPRPFMGPAMEKEKPKLPQMWRDSVR